MKINGQRGFLIGTPVRKMLIALCSVGTILLIWWVLRYSRYGFDFTDEGFYLVWIADPFLYDFSRTQFGFVYHVLYVILGGDIGAIRQANILITFGLAWCLVYVFLSFLSPGLKDCRISLLIVAAGLATSVLIIFSRWLLTPSYNSLNIQALMISIIGLILADKKISRISIAGHILIGIGGWLAFMAKPSTALALAVVAFVYLVFAQKFSIRMLLLAAASALICLFFSALLIDGSPWEFVQRINRGLEIGQALADKLDHILRIDDFSVGERARQTIILVSSALFAAMYGVCAKDKRWLSFGLLTSGAFFVVTGLLTFGITHRTLGLGQFQGILIFCLVYAAMMMTVVVGRLDALKTISVRQWALAALCLVMPHVYAFGTGNNYWHTGSQAAIFWLLFGLTFLAPLLRERALWVLLLPLTLATQAVTATLLQTGFEQPYRQPQPVRLNDAVVELGLEGSVLHVSTENAAYLNDAADAAEMAGFKLGDSVIDLSGQSPGLLFALGAKGIGHPWTLGGYPGSLSFLKAGLNRFSCEDLTMAWVLLEPEGPRSISGEALSSFGAVFPNGYERVGTWNTAKGAGGYAASRVQELYKPIKPQEALRACRALRSKNLEK